MADEIRQFLFHLPVIKHVLASTQNQALCALLFLYRDVLQVELSYVEGVERAKRPARVPVVFTRQEVERLLAQLTGTYSLIASLLYLPYALERKYPNAARERERYYRASPIFNVISI